MIISANTLEKLILAGVNGPELMELVHLIEEDTRKAIEAKKVGGQETIDAGSEIDYIRALNAERQARHRGRRKPVTARNVTLGTSNVTDNVTSNVTLDDASPLSPSPLSPPPKPPPYNPPNPIPPVHHQGEPEVSENTSAPKPKKTKTPELTPVEELMVVLSEEQARAVIGHRQKIGKPITAYAAKLLAGKFAKADSPSEAADHMIANGWQSFEPEWLENRARTHSRNIGPALPRPQHSPATERHFRIMDNLDKKIRELENEPDCETTIDLTAADYTAESWSSVG